MFKGNLCQSYMFCPGCVDDAWLFSDNQISGSPAARASVMYMDVQRGHRRGLLNDFEFFFSELCRPQNPLSLRTETPIPFFRCFLAVILTLI